MVVNQGDIFWANLGPARGSSAAGTRPVVVVQSEMFNRGGLNTIVTVPMTTRPGARNLPGNVGFRKGEANLPRACTAITPHIGSMDRRYLIKKIGTISRGRLEELHAAIDIVLRGADALTD